MTLNVFRVPSEGNYWELPNIKDFNQMLPELDFLIFFEFRIPIQIVHPAFM